MRQRVSLDGAPIEEGHAPGQPAGAGVDRWLSAPDNSLQRVADTRRSSMRLSALFEEFCQYLGVEKEAAPP